MESNTQHTESSATPSPLQATHRPGIAERLWEAGRLEFSERGYHGARVQGIARRAGCNVALLYRHWTSKKALYLDILRTVWRTQAAEVLRLLGESGAGAPAVVNAYLDAMLKDPVGSQLMIREMLDGAPHVGELVAAEPQLMRTMETAAALLRAPPASGAPSLRAGLDPAMVVLTVVGLVSLVAAARGVTRIFTGTEVSAEDWSRHLRDLLVNGIVPCPQG